MRETRIYRARVAHQVKNDAVDRLPGQSINRESPSNERTPCMTLRSSLFEDRRSSLLPQCRENLSYARLLYNVYRVLLPNGAQKYVQACK